MKFLQKLGKAIMLPVACLPLCGILMGIGYLLCPASMQGGEMTTVWQTVGQFLVKAGGAVIDHMALLFAVGIGVGMAKDRDGTAGIAALVSWLMITGLMNPAVVKTILPPAAENAGTMLAFQKAENPFIGILAGLIGSWSYNRFRNTTLPDWLAFFSGKRSTVIIAGLLSVGAAAVLFFAWPVLFNGLVSAGRWIAGLGPVGAGIYAFLNRLLIPLGLHHALNNVFWFDTIGLGDLTHFWAGQTSADVGWSLGIYMSGFFPCMMFGIPGAALAMIRSAKSKKRRAAVGILASAALCAFVCGITEPFEFAFMFAAPVLYVVYALLYGVFTWLTAASGFRAGFAFSAGATDLMFSASLPAAQKTWMIIPLGIAAFVTFYLTFRLMIRWLNMKTPGRDDDDAAETAGEPPAAGAPGTRAQENSAVSAPEDDAVVAGVRIAGILDGLGGTENVRSLDNCITRLRVEVENEGKVNDGMLKSAGARGVMHPGKNSVQVVIGVKVQGVADAVRERMAAEQEG